MLQCFNLTTNVALAHNVMRLCEVAVFKYKSSFENRICRIVKLSTGNELSHFA